MREAIAVVSAAIGQRLLALLTLLAFLATSPVGTQAVSMIAPVALIEQNDQDGATGQASSSAMDDSLGSSGNADPIHLLLIDGAWGRIIPAPTPPVWERISAHTTLALTLDEWHAPTALYLLYHCLLC